MKRGIPSSHFEIKPKRCKVNWLQYERISLLIVFILDLLIADIHLMVSSTCKLGFNPI